MTMMLMLLVYAGTLFVTKLFLSLAMTIISNFPYNMAWFKSFGISIEPANVTVDAWFTTLLPDLVAIFSLIFLIVINNEMRLYAKQETEMLLKEIPQPRDLHQHYQFWCYFCLFMTFCYSAAFPSFFSFFYLALCVAVIYFWYNHYKIEEAIFSVVSRIIFWGALVNVITGYVIFI